MLHIHRASRADVLADALSELLATPPADPFATDVVSVPTRGMERWLIQRMSAHLGASEGHRDGVCANVTFPFPARLVGTVLAAASGLDPAAEVWSPERAVWPLLEVLDSSRDQWWFSPLSSRLDGHRFATARRIVHRYDQYALRRPDMIRAWAQGESIGGDGLTLAPSSAWQPELWRALRAALATPSIPERLQEACEHVRADPTLLDLPSRLSLFGLTRLPRTHRQVLEAIASARDVHLFVLHPSPALWDRIDARGGAGGRPLPRAQDSTPSLAHNRLLASWGDDARELQLVLAGESAGRSDHLHEPQPAHPWSLLAAIQSDIRANRRAVGPPLPSRRDDRMPLADEDQSIQVHACHGRARQVQALHEAILHALESDRTLEPRDVIVMCPDIETFAPLITATFGAGEDATIALRVRLADRSLRSTNPLLAVLTALLELPGSRLTASEFLDLADAAPVRRRFEFDDDELTRIREWVTASRIHWGLDGAHRAPYGLGGVGYGTWEAGLRRILLGVAVGDPERSLFHGVVPIDDVDSGAIALAGRLAELLDRLHSALDQLDGSHPVTVWAAEIATAIDALTTTPERDAWQRAELSSVLEDVVAEAADVAATATLALSDVRALLADRLAGRPTRANFRTGELTVCTLVPMRSVPHRVVCLLGLDDGLFPRRTPRDGDDLLLEFPHVGDRDPRTEDRQLLLDALLAAGDRLIVTYTGNDERTNAVVPPAVVVGELLDTVDATASREVGDARDHVLIRHPLQPFDARNFLAGDLVPGPPWSFDEVELQGARVLRGDRADVPAFMAGPLAPPDGPAAVSLEDLIAFLARPVRAFLRQRLGISLRGPEDEVSDELPVELAALDRWGIGDRLLQSVIAGIDPETAMRVELARGTLPPGALGRPVLGEVWDMVKPIAERAREFGHGLEPRSIQTALTLPDGCLFTGTVSGVHGTVLLSATYSRLSPRHRLTAWARLLALSGAHPEEPFEAVTIGRGNAQEGVRISRLPILSGDPHARRRRSLELLGQLVDLRDRGMREPLPLPCLTAAAFAQAISHGSDTEQALEAALDPWRSRFRHRGEDAEPEHRLTFGPQAPLRALVELSPHEDENGGGRATAENSRFGRLARRLWEPLLAHERMESA